MRGAVTNLEGFSSIDIEVGGQDFEITYDADKLSTKAMQVALDASGQPCKLME